MCIWLCSVTCRIFYPSSFPVCLIDSSLSSFGPLPFLNFIPKCWHHWGLSLSTFSLFGIPSIRKYSCYPELQIPVICDLSSPIFFFFSCYSLYLGSQQVSLVEWPFESGYIWALWWIQSAVKKSQARPSLLPHNQSFWTGSSRFLSGLFWSAAINWESSLCQVLCWALEIQNDEVSNVTRVTHKYMQYRLHST